MLDPFLEAIVNGEIWTFVNYNEVFRNLNLWIPQSFFRGWSIFSKGDVKEVQKLMRDQNDTVTDKNGNMAIHMAAKHGKIFENGSLIQQNGTECFSVT